MHSNSNNGGTAAASGGWLPMSPMQQQHPMRMQQQPMHAAASAAATAVCYSHPYAQSWQPVPSHASYTPQQYGAQLGAPQFAPALEPLHAAPAFAQSNL